MKITEVRIYEVEQKKGSNLKAFASVTFDKEFVVTGVKILEGKKGLFVGMPSQKSSDNKFYDVCFPITKEFRDKITDKVLAEYKE